MGKVNNVEDGCLCCVHWSLYHHLIKNEHTWIVISLFQLSQTLEKVFAQKCLILCLLVEK